MLPAPLLEQACAGGDTIGEESDSASAEKFIEFAFER